MSIRIMAKVWDDLTVQSQAELLVLLTLADHARDDGLCWPSMRVIATKARIEERSAWRIVRRLIDSGRIELVSRGGCRRGQNIPNKYRITGSDPESDRRDARSGHGMTQGQDGEDDLESGRSDSSSGNGVTEGQGNHQKEPSNETTSRIELSPKSVPDETGEQTSQSSRFFDHLQAEFGLSAKQMEEVRGTADKRGADYVNSKAELVRTADVRSPAAAFITALRNDWQRSSKAVNRKNGNKKAARQVAPENPPGWREWLLEQGYREDKLPQNFSEFYYGMRADAERFLEKVKQKTERGI